MTSREDKLQSLRIELCYGLGESMYVKGYDCKVLHCRDCILNTDYSLNEELTRLCDNETITITMWRLDNYEPNK